MSRDEIDKLVKDSGNPRIEALHQKDYWSQGPQDWLDLNTGLTVEEFRQRQHEELREARPDWIGTEHDRPGGFAHKRFDEFTAQYQAGDEIWHYRSPEYSWRMMAGREGYAIVRDGKVVANYTTVLN